MDNINEYALIYPITIKWGEMDAFGHINNTVYFRYFEDARTKYFEEMSLIDVSRKMSIGPILGLTSCRYYKPLVYPDIIQVGARVRSCGKTSLVMENIIISPKIGLAATGEAVIVMYDYNKSLKVDVPDELKAMILDYEKREIDSCDVELHDF